MSIVHFILAMRLPYRGVYHPPEKKSPTRQLQIATEKLDKSFVQQLMIGGCVDYKAADHNGDSLLHLAFKRLHNQSDNLQLQLIKVLEIYLDSGLAVNRKNAAGETVLFLAVKHRLEHVIKFLIRRGARFDSPDERGNTTLHFVVEHEFKKFSGACLPNDSPVDERVVVRQLVMAQRMLMLTAKPRDEDEVRVVEPNDSFVRWVISKATKVDCKNFDGYNPLALAAKYNLLHIVLTLLKYTKDASFVNKKRQTVFHIFLESIARFDSYDQLSEGIPTFCYDKKYVTEIVQLMMEKGFSINAVDSKGNTPILIALKNEQTDIARTMLEYPIKKEVDKIEFSDDFSFVQLAVINKNMRVLQSLKENGADFSIKYRGNNLLHLLSASAIELPRNSIYEVIVDLLINEGCDANARNDEGTTPLHLASQAGIYPIVKRLIERGASVHSRELLSDRRFTPLHEAVDNNREDVIEVLVNAGADVNARTAKGQTPLHLAMLHASNMVNALLRLGGHVDARDDENRAPLYDAICYRNVTALKELLKFGGDINERGAIREINNLKDVGPVASVVLDHWIKLQAAGLPVDDYYRYQVVDRSFQICYGECVDEAERLKDCLFNDGTSMYELLRMNPNRRCAYVANREMKDLLLSPKLESLFPKYHVVIQASYHEATARYSLLEPAKCAWYELTDISLPEACVDKILSYVNNMTLRTMAGSLKDRSLRKGSYDS